MTVFVNKTGATTISATSTMKVYWVKKQNSNGVLQLTVKNTLRFLLDSYAKHHFFSEKASSIC